MKRGNSCDVMFCMVAMSSFLASFPSSITVDVKVMFRGETWWLAKRMYNVALMRLESTKSPGDTVNVKTHE